MLKQKLSGITLSIVIQNYNYGHFICDALDSLLKQTTQDFELIVIDDGSTDNSLEIIESYRDKFKNFQLIAYTQNKGTHYSINDSINVANGAYIHWLAADDFRDDRFVQDSMQILLNNPTIGICCSDFGYSDEKTGRFKLFSNKLIDNVSEDLVLDGESVVRLIQYSNFWIPGHTTIVKKESVIKYGGFRKELLEKCDWYLFHLIALKEGLAYLPRTLSYIYCHSASYSANISVNKDLKKKSANAVISILSKNDEFFSLFIRSTLIKHIVVQNYLVLFRSFKVWSIFYYCFNIAYLKRKIKGLYLA
jgi:glycosyltransferase involved in cell wall biosynthesis